MIESLNKENFFKSPFFILSMVALVLLVLLLIYLRKYYKKVNASKEEVKPVEEVKIEKVEEIVEPIKVEEVCEVETEQVYEEKTEVEEKQPVIGYKKSFISKLILNEELQEIYKDLETYINKYKVKSRISFKYERISLGRECLAKLLVRGKKLYLYLALNKEDVDAKYHLVDVSSKKIGKELPSLLKVQSNRSVKYAKELLTYLFEQKEVKLLNENKIVPIDFETLFRKRSMEEFIKDGLIVPYEIKGDFFNRGSEYLTEEEIIAITPEKADELVSDEKLEQVLTVKELNRSGKMEIVNIDELSEKFNDGDDVDLEALIDANLVSNNCKRVKILARGSLDKKLNIEADAISKQAMKMIVYKGGNVTIIK